MVHAAELVSVCETHSRLTASTGVHRSAASVSQQEVDFHTDGVKEAGCDEEEEEEQEEHIKASPALSSGSTPSHLTLTLWRPRKDINCDRTQQLQLLIQPDLCLLTRDWSQYRHHHQSST